MMEGQRTARGVTCNWTRTHAPIAPSRACALVAPSWCFSPPARPPDLEDPRQKKEQKKSCCGGSSASSSSSKFLTAGSDPSTNPYETQASVHEYLLMHYGTSAELLNFPDLQGQQMKAATNFPKECAELCGKYIATSPLAAQGAQGLRVLDVGCSVGRSSFELTRFFGEVTGLDYSQAFVDAANLLQLTGSATYTMRTEGDLVQHAVARVDPSLDRSKVKFVQGDACDLLATFPEKQFHVVLAANLLCRLPFPRLFLGALPRLIVAGGFLVMPSPYTWLEQYTPKSEWIGGFVDPKTGDEVKSFDGLKQRMLGDGYFELVDAFDLPFFIRETARKNQWSVSHVTVFRRTNKAVQ